MKLIVAISRGVIVAQFCLLARRKAGSKIPIASPEYPTAVFVLISIANGSIANLGVSITNNVGINARSFLLKYIHNGKAGMEFASAEGILLMKKTLKKGQ